MADRMKQADSSPTREIGFSETKPHVQESIKIQPYDTDYMGIVHNITYIRWFENLRMAMLDKYYALDRLLSSDVTPILAETHVVYKRPLAMLDQPLGRVWMEVVSRTRWEMHFEILCNGVPCCQGRQLGYCYSLSRKRPVHAPDDFYQAMNQGFQNAGS
jgi:acyl-CoA thioesterase FadM